MGDYKIELSNIVVLHYLCIRLLLHANTLKHGKCQVYCGFLSLILEYTTEYNYFYLFLSGATQV